VETSPDEREELLRGLYGGTESKVDVSDSVALQDELRANLLKDQTKDTGCSLKLFHRKDYLSLPYFDHMHRFLPALMMRDDVKIMHVDVSHRARTHGVSKYGTLDRLFAGIYDLVGVMWLQKRGQRTFDIHEEIEMDLEGLENVQHRNVA